MRAPVWSSQFKRDLKAARKRGDEVRFERTGRHTDLFDE